MKIIKFKNDLLSLSQSIENFTELDVFRFGRYNYLFNQTPDARFWSSQKHLEKYAFLLLEMPTVKKNLFPREVSRGQWTSLCVKTCAYRREDADVLQLLQDRALQVDKWCKSRYYSELNNMPYAEYLKTEHWQKLRERAKERDGNKCVLCSSKERLEVHHSSYEHRGRDHYEIDDIVTLCHECHSKYHNK